MHPSATFGLPPRVIKWWLFFFYGVPTPGLHGKYLEDFGLGMLVSALYIYGRNIDPDSLFRRFLARISPLLFVAGLAFLAVMVAWKYTQRDPHSWPLFATVHMQHLYSYLSEFNFGLGYALCVTAILFGGNWLARPFAWTPLRWIGLVSYGLYMWHLLLLESFTKLVIIHLPQWPPLALYLSYWVWVFIFIIPAVVLLFALVEKPWVQLGDLWTRRKKAAMTAEVVARNVQESNGFEPQVTQAAH